MSPAWISGIPFELIEAARIDGAGEFWILARIIAPLSYPVGLVVLLLSTMLIPFPAIMVTLYLKLSDFGLLNSTALAIFTFLASWDDLLFHSIGVLILMAASVIVPFLWLLLGSFKQYPDLIANPSRLPSPWTIANYLEIFGIAKLGAAFVNSLVLAVARTLLALTQQEHPEGREHRQHVLAPELVLGEDVSESKGGDADAWPVVRDAAAGLAGTCLRGPSWSWCTAWRLPRLSSTSLCQH